MNYRKEWKYEYGLEPVQAKAKTGVPMTWTNTGPLTHTFSARDKSWTTGPIPPGQSKSVTIGKPGTYDYTCVEHPWTIGRLVVE
jgi:plastocyanin